jgi:hypothetical protein
MSTGRILKYVTHGGTSALALHYIADGNNYINLFGYGMDVRLAGFVLGASSSALVDVIHNYIDPSIGVKGSMNDLQSQMIALGLSAGTFYGLTMIGNKDLASYNPSYLIGAAVVSEMAAQYVYNNFVNPMVLGQPSSMY